MLCYYGSNLYDLTEMLKEAVLIIFATSAFTAHSFLAQLPEQTTEEGKGFYTNNCKVTITRNNQKVFEKPCTYFAITIKAQANFHFGFTVVYSILNLGHLIADIMVGAPWYQLVLMVLLLLIGLLLNLVSFQWIKYHPHKNSRQVPTMV